MGTSTILDIIASFFVFGLLLLMGLRLKESANENTFIYNSSLNLQLNLVTVTASMEDDLKKIGYAASGEIKPGSAAVLKADSTKFRFKGDFDNDGKIDSIEWGLGNKDYSSSNKNCYSLYRTFWSGAGGAAAIESMRVGATQFRFKYKTQDSDSNILAYPVNLSKYSVGLVDIAVTLEARDKMYSDTGLFYAQDTSLYKVYWREFRIIGKNIAYR